MFSPDKSPINVFLEPVVISNADLFPINVLFEFEFVETPKAA